MHGASRLHAFSYAPLEAAQHDAKPFPWSSRCFHCPADPGLLCPVFRGLEKRYRTMALSPIRRWGSLALE